MQKEMKHIELNIMGRSASTYKLPEIDIDCEVNEEQANELLLGYKKFINFRSGDYSFSYDVMWVVKIEGGLAIVGTVYDERFEEALDLDATITKYIKERRA